LTFGLAFSACPPALLACELGLVADPALLLPDTFPPSNATIRTVRYYRKKSDI